MLLPLSTVITINKPKCCLMIVLTFYKLVITKRVRLDVSK